MPRAVKGQRFGGRVGGVPNKKTVRIAQEAAAMVAQTRQKRQKLAISVLGDFMTLFAGMAAYYQPPPPGQEAPPERKPDEAKFLTYARLAVETAADLANYQSPKFKALMVGGPSLDDDQ